MKNLVKFNNKLFPYYFLVITFCFSLFTFSFPNNNNTKASTYWLNAQNAPFSEGNGTENEPYIISTREHFAYFASVIMMGQAQFLGASYALGNSIDVSGYIWVPLSITNSSFRFFGNFHSIENLTLDNTSYVSGETVNSGGFFSDFAGILKETSFNNVNIHTDGLDNMMVCIATLANVVTGAIDYVQIVNLNIVSDAALISGIAHSVEGNITNTFVTGNISGIYIDKYTHQKSYTTTTKSTTGSSTSATHSGDYETANSKSYTRTLPTKLFQQANGLANSIEGGLVENCYFAGKIDVFSGSLTFKTTPSSRGTTKWTHLIIFNIHLYSSTTVEGLSMRFNCGNLNSSFSSSSIQTEISREAFLNYNYNYSYEQSTSVYPLSPSYWALNNCYYFIEQMSIEYRPGEFQNLEPDSTMDNKERSREEMKKLEMNDSNEYYVVSDSNHINFGFPRLKGFYWEDAV